MAAGVAVCYLSDQGRPGRSFNKMLVDAGHARIEDFKNNEFDPGAAGPEGGGLWMQRWPLAELD